MQTGAEKAWYCTASLSIKQIQKAIVSTGGGTTLTGITPPLIHFFDN